MSEPVVVRFSVKSLNGLHRHRVGVWDARGGLLRPASAESPGEVEVPDGESIVIEASVPADRTGKARHAREEGRWRLKANAEATDVLKLGKTPKYGTGSGIEITVEGAKQSR